MDKASWNKFPTVQVVLIFHIGDWLLLAPVLAMFERSCIPLNVTEVRGRILDKYEGKTMYEEYAPCQM
jgi:hypothetical protein